MNGYTVVAVCVAAAVLGLVLDLPGLRFLGLACGFAAVLYTAYTADRDEGVCP